MKLVDALPMPRSRNIYNTHFPYHITARTNDGLPFPCELDQAWDVYSHALWFCSHVFQTRVLAFVMMSNHFHLLMTTPEGNLSEFMKYFMKRTSDDIRSFREIKNHLYGDRYYPSLIDNQRYFETVLKYIYQNPLRAGICKSVSEYRYSTLPGLLGSQALIIPIMDDYHFFDDLSENLNWLDQRYDLISTEQIRHGLKQQSFKPKPDKNYFLDDTHLNRLK